MFLPPFAVTVSIAAHCRCPCRCSLSLSLSPFAAAVPVVISRHGPSPCRCPLSRCLSPFAVAVPVVVPTMVPAAVRCHGPGPYRRSLSLSLSLPLPLLYRRISLGPSDLLRDNLLLSALSHEVAFWQLFLNTDDLLCLLAHGVLCSLSPSPSLARGPWWQPFPFSFRAQLLLGSLHFRSLFTYTLRYQSPLLLHVFLHTAISGAFQYTTTTPPCPIAQLLRRSGALRPRSRARCLTESTLLPSGAVSVVRRPSPS